MNSSIMNNQYRLLSEKINAEFPIHNEIQVPSHTSCKIASLRPYIFPPRYEADPVQIQTHDVRILGIAELEREIIKVKNHDEALQKGKKNTLFLSAAAVTIFIAVLAFTLSYHDSLAATITIPIGSLFFIAIVFASLMRFLLIVSEQNRLENLLPILESLIETLKDDVQFSEFKVYFEKHAAEEVALPELINHYKKFKDAVKMLKLIQWQLQNLTQDEQQLSILIH